MRKELLDWKEVPASADDIWAVYSSPDLPKLMVSLLPSVFDSIDIVEGDGGVGTVLHVTYPPGSVPLTYKERFVVMDQEKRLKEILQIEGGYLDMGCTFYLDSFNIFEKDSDSCIIKSRTVFEVPDELAEEVFPYITIASLANMAETISTYVMKKRSKHKHGVVTMAEIISKHVSKHVPDRVKDQVKEHIKKYVPDHISKHLLKKRW